MPTSIFCSKNWCWPLLHFATFITIILFCSYQCINTSLHFILNHYALLHYEVCVINWGFLFIAPLFPGYTDVKEGPLLQLLDWLIPGGKCREMVEHQDGFGFWFRQGIHTGRIHSTNRKCFPDTLFHVDASLLKSLCPALTITSAIYRDISTA